MTSLNSLSEERVMSNIEVGSVWVNKIHEGLTLTITHNFGKAIKGLLSDGRSYNESPITLGSRYRPENIDEYCNRKNRELKDDMSTIYDQPKEQGHKDDNAKPKHSHYKHDVRHIDTLDIYWICELYVDDKSGCIQHAVKKLLCCGNRGVKDNVKDLQEAIDTIQRKIEILQSMESDK